MKKLFRSTAGRDILIEIDKDHILFYHNDVIERQERWVYEQREQGNEVSEEETVPEFYWIYKKEWKNNDRNWHKHMEEKNWFTTEMKDFLNKNS